MQHPADRKKETKMKSSVGISAPNGAGRRPKLKRSMGLWMATALEVTKRPAREVVRAPSARVQGAALLPVQQCM
jgi:hypothetical protein